MIASARLDQLKPAWRKRIVHGALIEAGSWFIAANLPKRFTGFARSDLGYVGPTEYSKKDIYRALRLNGTLARFFSQYTHGWDPWSKTPAPTSLVKHFVEVVSGTTFAALRSRTGQFKTLKKGLRHWCKTKIREAAQNWIDDQGGIDKEPWVLSGALRDAATKARPVARTNRAGQATLRIVVPRPHALRPRDAVAFTRFTPDEITHMGAMVARSVAASLRTGVPHAKTGLMTPTAPHRTHLMELLARSKKTKDT